MELHLNLYLLERSICGYDEYYDMTITANNEAEAREMAGLKESHAYKLWTNKKIASCSLIGKTKYKRPRIIAASFNAA